MLAEAAPGHTAVGWSAACRPTLLFAAAYALNMTLHEAVQAGAAYCLGVPSTLFHLWVNLRPGHATPAKRAIVAAAGPAFSLSVGVACWVIYQRCRQRPSGLLILMLVINGIYGFLGNLFAAALDGDISIVLRLLGMPGNVRYALSTTGLLLLSLFMLFTGRELLRWAPRGLGRGRAVVRVTVAPWLVEAALAILVYWPLPAFLIDPTLVGSVFCQTK